MLTVKTVNEATQAVLVPAIEAWHERYQAAMAAGDIEDRRALMLEICRTFDVEWKRQHERILALAWKAATAETPTYRRESAWIVPMGFRDSDYRAHCRGRALNDVKRLVGAFSKRRA